MQSPCANCHRLTLDLPDTAFFAAQGLSIAQAAKLLRVDRATLGRWLKNGAPAWRRAELVDLKRRIAFQGGANG